MDFLKANQSYSASLTADYTAGDGTLSVNTLPENTPTIVTVARGTDKETRFTVTGAGGGLLTGVTRLDGANENISSGVSVECMIDADFINQLESAVFNQEGLKGLVYAADGGASDAYEITLPVAPTSLSDITGVPIVFKANTANTGAATLEVNNLTAKTIKKLADQDLDTGDILEGQAVLVIYDGTNFQMLGDIPVTVPTAAVTDAGGYVKPTTSGDDIRTYDGDGDDYLEVAHDGTDSKIITNKGHVVITPATSKFVKVAALEQIINTNTYRSNVIVLTGWNFITGDGSNADYTKTITFGVTFSTPPIIVAIMAGSKTTSDPTAITDFTGGLPHINSSYSNNVSATGFTMNVSFNAAYANGTRAGFTWIAIGTLA